MRATELCSFLLRCLLFAAPLAAQQSEPAKHLEQGAAHLQRNQLDPAIRELIRAIAINPRSAPAHLLLGQAYLAKGAAELIAEAKAEFQQAQDIDPSQTLASFYIAKIDLDLGRLQRAENEIHRALAQNPGSPYLVALLGEIRRRQGNPEEAAALATRALSSDSNAAPVLYFRALAYWDQKKEAEALADLNRAIASSFVTPEMYQTLGSIHLHHNRLVEAETAFRKAMQLNPRVEASLRLAQTLRRQRRFEEALFELKKVESAPQFSSEYFQDLMAAAACEKGLIHRDQGDLRAARAAFERALDTSPQNEEARRNLNALR
ncbi:MAG TPA: tetratricopeptide repeat protein [Bryobacteraceae bacterium]|nr:tetratricopeptide repeat protein [Bryobacteraceae bacterium]